MFTGYGWFEHLFADSNRKKWLWHPYAVANLKVPIVIKSWNKAQKNILFDFAALSLQYVGSQYTNYSQTTVYDISNRTQYFILGFNRMECIKFLKVWNLIQISIIPSRRHSIGSSYGFVKSASE